MSEEDRRANRATAFSMLLAAVLVVVAVTADANWLTGILMVFGGLALQFLASIIGFAILNQIRAGRIWAMRLVRMIWPIAPIAIAIYVAGLLTLGIKGLRVGWTYIVGN